MEEIKVCSICGCMWQERIFDECPVCRLRKLVRKLETALMQHGMI